MSRVRLESSSSRTTSSWNVTWVPVAAALPRDVHIVQDYNGIVALSLLHALPSTSSTWAYCVCLLPCRGYNEPMRTRVHNNAGNKCEIKDFAAKAHHCKMASTRWCLNMPCAEAKSVEDPDHDNAAKT
eukprot:3340028-Amphidinium_carterae.1